MDEIGKDEVIRIIALFCAAVRCRGINFPVMAMAKTMENYIKTGDNGGTANPGAAE